jgi:uncharacterized membrane protein YgcG
MDGLILARVVISSLSPAHTHVHYFPSLSLTHLYTILVFILLFSFLAYVFASNFFASYLLPLFSFPPPPCCFHIAENDLSEVKIESMLTKFAKSSIAQQFSSSSSGSESSSSSDSSSNSSSSIADSLLKQAAAGGMNLGGGAAGGSSMSVREYDVKQAEKLRGEQLMPMCFMWFLHFKRGATQPIIFQALMVSRGKERGGEERRGD